MMDSEKLLKETRAEILAYFTLAIHSLPIPKTASKSLLKKLVGSKSNAKSISAYFIRQLAKNDLFVDKISGKEIFGDRTCRNKRRSKICRWSNCSCRL